MSMRISVDTDRCQGHGMCYVLAPNTFEDDDAGFGRVVAPSPDGEDSDLARDAAAQCPERAIVIDETSGE